ncbi:MAG TPA: class IV adenylate cyclase, partial [Acidobacteriota bacterium]|nr:class IV adenylate cyclase [Acidobacteriota bacterium]
ELIYYERADQAEARLSSYNISVTHDPSGLLSVLTRALGRRAVVRKHRELYLLGTTRIHLDTVEGLGEFIELEYVMRPEEDEVQGQRVVSELMRQLGISEDDLIDSAYVDLLAKSESAR